MFQLVKIIDSSAPHQGDIRCCKKNGGEAENIFCLTYEKIMYSIIEILS